MFAKLVGKKLNQPTKNSLLECSNKRKMNVKFYYISNTYNKNIYYDTKTT